ncbi:MAG: Do family serine endopeptidase [Acidobacteriota bacterium]
MKRNGQLLTLALIASASVIFGMVLAGGLNLTVPGRTAQPAFADDQPLHAAARAQMTASGRPGSIPASFADIAEMVNPAVVSITATELIEPRRRGRRPFHGDPFEFFFGPERRRFPMEPEEPRFEHSGGSGFLISDDGFILTNYHVVENASRIRVTLSGDPRDYDAQVVGSDPSTDLALIKVDLGKKLPYLRLGDSDSIRVGDWVVAVGNPLAYDHTVTVGVVSAKGRRLGSSLGGRDFSFDDFIQTDAAINFGNSGGPLVNISGEVIGVNTAISSVGEGIGFAVPINIAKGILDQLKTSGRVSRGYLGITLGPITPDLQEAWGLEDDRGAVVQSVLSDFPAARAGVKRGDVIVAVDGTRVESTEQVVRLVSSKAPGTTVELTVLREGREVTIRAELVDRPPRGRPEAGRGGEGQPGRGEPIEEKLGLVVGDLSPGVLEQIDLPRDTEGVIVTRISQASEAFEKGLGRTDVIAEVNRVPVRSVGDFRREIRKARPGDLIVLYVIHPPTRTGGDPQSRYVTLRLREEED